MRYLLILHFFLVACQPPGPPGPTRPPGSPSPPPRPSAAPPGPTFYQVGTLFLVRTAFFSNNTAARAFIDVIAPLPGGGGAVIDTLDTNITLGSSPAEGGLGRSEDGCYVTLSGYGVPEGVQDPERVATAPRITLVFNSSGAMLATTDYAAAATIDRRNASSVRAALTLQLPQPPRSGRALQGPGPGPRPPSPPPPQIVLATSVGVFRPQPAGSTRNASGAVVSGGGGPAAPSPPNLPLYFPLQVYGAVVHRRSVFASIYQGGGGIYEVPLPLSPPPMPRQAVALPLAPSPRGITGPTEIVFIDDVRMLVAHASLGALLVTANGTAPDGAGGFRATGWAVRGAAAPPGGGGIAHVGIDTSMAGASPHALFAVTAPKPGPRGNTSLVYRVGLGPNSSVALRSFIESDPGQVYRGVAGVPRCVPLPAPTAFPPPAPPLPSRPPGGGGAAAAGAAGVFTPDTPGGIGTIVGVALGGALLLAGVYRAGFAHGAARVGAASTTAAPGAAAPLAPFFRVPDWRLSMSSSVTAVNPTGPFGQAREGSEGRVDTGDPGAAAVPIPGAAVELAPWQK